MDRTEFLLKEGVTTFMVAAWNEHRWCLDAYQSELDLAGRRLSTAIEQWQDVKLTYRGEYPSIGVRRAFQYSKGALFLATLRTELGDDAFWKALRSYSMTYKGKTVTSRDLQASFEKSSRRDLSALFDVWVY